LPEWPEGKAPKD